MDADTTVEDLRRQIEELQRRVEELEVPARRYNALFSRSTLSLQIYDPQSRPLAVNQAYEKLWRLKIEEITEYVAWRTRSSSPWACYPTSREASAASRCRCPSFATTPRRPTWFIKVGPAGLDLHLPCPRAGR